MKKHKIWQFNEFNKEEAKRLGAEAGISPLVAGILLNRGITDASTAHEFLYGSDEPFHDPFLMKDMAKSVERIWQAIERKERITVYGDYDVDGISASSLLYLFLKDCGADVNTYIPERKSEGYGLNIEALWTAASAPLRKLPVRLRGWILSLPTTIRRRRFCPRLMRW